MLPHTPLKNYFSSLSFISGIKSEFLRIVKTLVVVVIVVVVLVIVVLVVVVLVASCTKCSAV